MRLIDVDKLIEDIHKRNYISKALSEIFETIIDEQPLAYDVDGVVKEINEWTFNANIDVGDGTVMNHNLIVRDTAIEIVKAGGNIELSEHSKSQGDRTGE